MLNTRYIIAANPQTNQPMVFPNLEAYGPCWLVKNVKIVNDAVEEIQALGTTNLRDTAIAQKNFSQVITQPQWDSSASIRLTKFDNDQMEYSSKSAAPQFAVFSEVYYPYGWNAYIDGKKVEYCRTNYILRGLSIPAGEHAIKLVFEPVSYKRGVTIAYVASFLIAILVLGGLFIAWRQTGKPIQPLRMKKVLSIVPYQYIPYFSGGQKSIAQFNEYLGKITDLTVISTPDNDINLIKDYTLLPLLANGKSRYTDVGLIYKIRSLIKKQIQRCYLGASLFRLAGIYH